MSPELMVGRLFLVVAWQVMKPQIPGCITVAAFGMGCAFVWKLLHLFGAGGPGGGGGSEWKESRVKGVEYRAKGGK